MKITKDTIVVKSMDIVYDNFDAFYRKNNVDKNSEDKYMAIIEAIDFNKCRSIALSFATLDQYKEAYKKDNYLNNILKEDSKIRKHGFQWLWDDMGYMMINSNIHNICFNAYSLNNLTCLAKACVKNMIKEEL